MQKPSFKLDAEESVLEYRNPEHQLVWQIPLESIVLMAEYTTNEGPHIDDYFLVFVSADGDSLNIATASFYADGRDEIVRNLAQTWKSNIELSLVNSTEWASRVVWPPTLVGKEYFEPRVAEPKKLAEKLRRFAFGPVHQYFPSQSVREFLLSRIGERSFD
jgi:hypothetical protein